MSEYKVMISWDVGPSLVLSLRNENSNEFLMPLGFRDLALVFLFRNNISHAVALHSATNGPSFIGFTVTGSLSIHNLSSPIQKMTEFTQVYKSETEMRKTYLPLQGCSSVQLPFTDSNNGIHYLEYLREGKYRIVISGYLIFSLTPETKKGKNIDDKQLLKLSVDLGRLNRDQAPFSDFHFKCSETVIPAHRIILAARSPVFAAMFENKLLESQTGFVDIIDIEPSIIRMMLTYIYSGKCDELTESSAGQLLFAADKYQLEELREICTCFLKENFSLDNILQYVISGDMHDAKLKTYALEFICKCDLFLKLEETSEWKCLKKENPALAMDVLTAIVKHDRK